MKRVMSFFMICSLMAACAGCGYTTAALLPPELDSIYVENFANEIDPTREVSNRRPTYSYKPGMEVDITRAVIDGFIYDRHLDVVNEKKAALILKGALVDFQQLPLSYSKGDSIVEFRMEIFVDIELYDNLNGELMWQEDRFMGQTSYTVSGPNAKTESQAIAAAVNDLAQRIVERTVEAW